MRVEHKGSTAAWLTGTLAVPSVLGHRLPLPQEFWPYQSFVLSLLQLAIRRPLWPVFLRSSACSLRGLPCLQSFSAVQLIRHIGGPLAGLLLCRLAHQALKGAPWVGSYSVIQCVRCLMGQPLYCSAADDGLWGERGYSDGSTPMHDSAVSPCFHGCPAFLHRHFPPQSPPSHPLDPSLHSQQQPSPWDCATIPKLQLPVAVPSRGPASLSRVCMTAQGLSDSHST